jgi:1,2-diacylglycerol 3-beta-galactosyltransferase
MPQLMKASDLLVTKAGPGTLAEAFTVRLPVVIFDYIPGQEAGNVQYVLEHEAGAYAPTPDEIAHVVRAWLRPDAASAATLRRVVANAAALARPEATLTIAQRLYALLQGARDKKKPPRC